MIYFFWKHQQFVQCEIHPGRPHVFRLIDSGGEEHTERYDSAEDLQDRWSELTRELTCGGWSGPFGRDARV
jgi:hypothetical protein